jgi:hypothetical protein
VRRRDDVLVGALVAARIRHEDRSVAADDLCLDEHVLERDLGRSQVLRKALGFAVRAGRAELLGDPYRAFDARKQRAAEPAAPTGFAGSGVDHFRA